MYFCPLIPIPHLKELGECRISVVLPHLIGDGDNYYTEFYRGLSERGTYTILNNGGYEARMDNRRLPSLDEMLELAELVGAREIQFSEKFWDGEETVESVKAWIETMGKKELKSYSWHAVVQGKDHQSYVSCFEKLAELLEVSVIGIPKVVTPHCYSRICGTTNLAATRIFALNELAKKTTKPLHLLGLEDPREVLEQRKWGPKIKSVDSSFPVIHAIHGISYSLERTEYTSNLPRFEFSEQLQRNILKRALHNIETVKSWCEDRWSKRTTANGHLHTLA